MQDKKDSFVFYRSFFEAIKDLPDNEQLQLYKAICNLALDEVEIELNGIANTLFKLIKPNIVANTEKWRNGSKGGRPKKPKDKNEKTTGYGEEETTGFENKKPNENVNEDVNDNVNVDEKEEETADQISKNRYGEYRNVYLDENDYNKALSICLDEKYLNELIEAVGEAIEKGKYNVYDETRPHAHLALVKAFHKHRMQNPSKYRQPQSQEDEIERLKRMHEEMMRKEREEEESREQ